MPALYITSPRLWCAARDARDRATAILQQNPAAPALDVAVAVVMSVTAAEAFIKELAEVSRAERDSGNWPTMPGGLSALVDALAELEEQQGSLLLKYLVASILLSGKAFDRGSNPFQDFPTLTRVRNDLLHFRPLDNI